MPNFSKLKCFSIILLPTSIMLLIVLLLSGCGTIPESKVLNKLQSETSRTILLYYALKNPSGVVRSSAAKRICDLKYYMLLEQLVAKSLDDDVQRIAISGVDNDDLILMTAFDHTKSLIVRDAAAERIDDQILLADLFTQRLASAEKIIGRLSKEALTSQDVQRRLNEVVKDVTESNTTRGAALLELSEDDDWLYTIETQQGIAKILSKTKDSNVRIKAERFLTAQNALFWLVFNTRDRNLLEFCVKNIYRNQLLFEIARDHEDAMTRARAKAKITDPQVKEQLK